MKAFGEGYEASLRLFLRHKPVVIVPFLTALGLTYLVYQRVPRGFILQEDAGYFIVIVQAPEGDSLEYTVDICNRVQAALTDIPEVAGVFTVAGFSFGGSAPNRALIFVPLENFCGAPGRGALCKFGHQSAARPTLRHLRRARHSLLSPRVAGGRPIRRVSIRAARPHRDRPCKPSQTSCNKWSRLAIVAPDLRGLFTSFTANDPQYVVTFDRERAKALQVPFNQITEALQVYMGSVYVNDFDLNNRSYRVYVQADKQFRSQPSDIRQYYVRSNTGMMIPLENVAAVQQTASPQVINHYNLFRSTEINGSPAPVRSTGEAMAAMDALARRMLPQGFAYEWTGLSLEELQSAGQTTLLFGLGMLVAYLALAAQYESFPSPSSYCWQFPWPC